MQAMPCNADDDHESFTAVLSGIDTCIMILLSLSDQPAFSNDLKTDHARTVKSFLRLQMRSMSCGQQFVRAARTQVAEKSHINNPSQARRDGNQE